MGLHTSGDRARLAVRKSLLITLNGSSPLNLHRSFPRNYNRRLRHGLNDTEDHQLLNSYRGRGIVPPDSHTTRISGLEHRISTFGLIFPTIKQWDISNNFCRLMAYKSIKQLSRGRERFVAIFDTKLTR